MHIGFTPDRLSYSTTLERIAEVAVLIAQFAIGLNMVLSCRTRADGSPPGHDRTQPPLDPAATRDRKDVRAIAHNPVAGGVGKHPR